MKRNGLFLLLVLFCLILAANAHAETLKLYQIAGWGDGYKQFMKAHPEITVTGAETYYSSTDQLSGALLTGEFDFDAFGLNLAYMNPVPLIQKGYCMDLSESQAIQDAVARMWPSITERLMVDGKIYAIPDGIAFDLFTINPDTWAMAELTAEDVPTSYPEFLTFLENWVAHVEANPEYKITVNSMFDETVYNSATYTQWLTGMLLDNYIMQLQYAGQPLRFDNPELIALLDRTKAVGKALYNCEPANKQGTKGLFDTPAQMHWPQNMTSNLVTLRINNNQPRLVTAMLDVVCIHATSKNKDKALELLAGIATQPMEVYERYLFMDAEPLKDPNRAENIAIVQKVIARLELKLADPSAVTGDSWIDSQEKPELEALLEKQKLSLEELYQKEYSISPELLAQYREFANLLYFKTPSLFSPGTDEGIAMTNLVKRFAAGNITAKELVQELDRMAVMVERES